VNRGIAVFQDEYTDTAERACDALGTFPTVVISDDRIYAERCAKRLEEQRNVLDGNILPTDVSPLVDDIVARKKYDVRLSVVCESNGAPDFCIVDVPGARMQIGDDGDLEIVKRSSLVTLQDNIVLS